MHLNARFQVISLAYKILHGLELRRAVMGVLRCTMESGARGCQILVSGKIAGERAKALKVCDGYIFHAGNQKSDHMDVATDYCCLRAGVVGFKITIVKPERLTKKPFPDVVKTKPNIIKEVLPLTFSYTGFAPIGPDWDTALLRRPPKIKPAEKPENPEKTENHQQKVLEKISN